MKSVKTFVVMVLFALVSSTAIAQTSGTNTNSEMYEIYEFDRLQQYISLNVANIQNWSNIVVSLLEELEEDNMGALHDNPYYWEFVYKEFKACLEKASNDLAIYNKVPPTEDFKKVVAGYKDKILPNGYELLNMFLRKAKLNNYITNV